MSDIKKISFYSFLLFIVPIFTVSVCYYLNVIYYDLNSVPFLEGDVSVSQVGRQVKTILIFKVGFCIYILNSMLYYYELSLFFKKNFLPNYRFYFACFSNFFLLIYLFCLAKDNFFLEIFRKFSIILFILSMYINHLITIKNITYLKKNRIIKVKNIYFFSLIIIYILMTVLILVGSPWVNPFFTYPDKIKNIVEWNFLLLMIIYYIPTCLIFIKNR